VSHASAPQAIDEHNRLPQVTLTTTAEPGTPLSTIRARITAAAARVPLPSGYSYLLGGVAQQQREAFAPLLFALALSPLLVYMLLAALYESLLLPFAVLLSVPLATAGALAALAAAGTTVNIFSLIGLLMLIGLVSKNAILLVDYIETRAGAACRARTPSSPRPGPGCARSS
jgi:hydrophobic/amphiphilic exporter-1 (mainly G- bacteria), HAE1 family